MNGILIDCYRLRDKIVLWIKKDNQNLRLEDTFTPKIYLKGPDLKGIQKKLLEKNIKSRLTRKKSFYQGREIWALEIPIFKLSAYHSLAKYIENITPYTIEMYNSDLQLEEAYLFEKNLFPLAQVEFSEKNKKITRIKALDDAADIDYKIPEFAIAKIAVKTKENLFKDLKAELAGLRFNDQFFEGNEAEILEQLKNNIEKEDPDILWIENGNKILPYLKHKASQHSINLQFNRFENDDIQHKEGSFFWSYNKVVYRTHSTYLKGRLHFDTRSFFAEDVGFYGIIDASRICRQRIQRTQMRSAGACVTNLLLYTAYKNNFLLPARIGIRERVKGYDLLYEADRGPIIYEPRIGFHKDVVEFDFISLYPNIMNKYNLSPETLFCRCCRWNKVPGLHYNYCTKQRGIVAMVAEQLIKRRIELKEQNTSEAKQKVNFLKWLLVTMFGYQAFKNKKIGNIENHESIQAYAREIILQSTRIAESLGWDVVHGITDSIYVKKENFHPKEVEILGRDIYYGTKMEVKHEGNYRWIVFLPSLLDVRIPVPNRFYGVFEDGELKCRGIEARRKDTPQTVVNLQMEIIELLSKAKDFEEFKAKFPKIFQILKNYIKALPHATAEELIIYRRLTKTNYKNDIAQKMVIESLQKQGYEVYPGQTISYIIKDVRSPKPQERYAAVDDFDGCFDIKKYTDLLVRAVFSLLQPFDVTVELLYDIIGEKQKTLSCYSMAENLMLMWEHI